MTPSGLAERISDIIEVPRDLLLGRYPPFVSGGTLPEGDVPVFVFHSVEPVRFGAQLDHLDRNDYVTLSVDQYFAHLTGRQAAPPRAVLLTFDDARGSLWSVGAPLLRRHGMRGLVFVVPGKVSSRPGAPDPTLDDVDAGRSRLDEILARESGDRPFLTWEEIESLAREGVFDFESHTLSHSRVHCAAKRVGFVTPDSRLGYQSFDLPIQSDGGRDLIGEDIPLGSPVLRSAPRLSECRRVYESPLARRACADEVEERGGPPFFARPGWRRTLESIARRFPPVVGAETAKDRASAIEGELLEARRKLEHHTGRVVRHLCYPWHAASPLARDLARTTGHSSTFCGKVRGSIIARAGDDPFAIPRIGEDWVELLPGSGRSTLRRILSRKWTRRLGGA
jgi:peptidoglycan/xylan/chitin deacetylase (PgdA/CDA1 family)